MSFQITVEVSVTVQDETQAEKIIEAAANGLAEIAIKDRVLFGGVTPTAVPVVTSTVSAVRSTSTSSAKAEEDSIKLKPVEVKIPVGKVTVQEPAPKPERSRGILGRRPMNRTGRK